MQADEPDPLTNTSESSRLVQLEEQLKASRKENALLKVEINELKELMLYQCSNPGNSLNNSSSSKMDLVFDNDHNIDESWYDDTATNNNKIGNDFSNRQLFQSDPDDITKGTQRINSKRDSLSSNRYKLHPINMFNCNHKKLVSLLNKNNKLNYNIKQINNSKSAIYTSSTADHKFILSTLETNNINHFMYTRKEDKIAIWLLKGVSPEYTADEIKQELDAICPKDVQITKVSKFSTKTAQKEGRQLPMFVVHPPRLSLH